MDSKNCIELSPRYIDTNKIDWDSVEYKHGKRDDKIIACKSAVENTPTEDVVPVIHAHFDWRFADNGWKDIICSNCKHIWNVDVQVYLDYDYCPYCGAKMDEVV